MVNGSCNRPSVDKTVFTCPSCNAIAKQGWYDLYTNKLNTESSKPCISEQEMKQHISSLPYYEDQEAIDVELNWIEKIRKGKPFFEVVNSEELDNCVENIHVTACSNCGEIAVWVHEKLIYPFKKFYIQPNKDLPDDILELFEEASQIVESSPRGAAALLRLCLQKLCIHLGELGESLDKDIGSLVKKGLDPTVEKAMDIIRVYGNESVHPGEINLSDEPNIAKELFKLINFIADKMISPKKMVDELYETLPETKVKSINKRNQKARDKEESNIY